MHILHTLGDEADVHFMNSRSETNKRLPLTNPNNACGGGMPYLQNSPSLNPLKNKASVKMAGSPVLKRGTYLENRCD